MHSCQASYASGTHVWIDHRCYQESPINRSPSVVTNMVR